jgi:hypothetical protein
MASMVCPSCSTSTPFTVCSCSVLMVLSSGQKMESVGSAAVPRNFVPGMRGLRRRPFLYDA